MDKDFYQQLLSDLKDLNDKKDYKNLLKLVEDELAMPYVPKDVLEKLEEYKTIANQNLNTSKPLTFMSATQIEEALKQGGEIGYKALDTLANSNIRNYLDLIKDLLVDDEINHTLKALLVELLVSQEIDDFIQIKDGNKDYEIKPKNLPLAVNQKNVGVILNQLYRYLFDNPSILQQCRIVLINAVYNHYPELIKDSEVEIVLFSVIRYVFKAYDNENDWQEFKIRNKVDESLLEEYLF